MSFQFSTYSATELSECGSQFVAAFDNLEFASDKTPDRSNAVFAWFCRTKAPGLRCYGRPADSEFLVDQCHATNSLPYLDRSGGWDQPLAKPCEMKLALECEWGKYKNLRETLALVLDDACKIAMVRATAKVVIFPTHQGLDKQQQERRRMVDTLRSLRTQSGDDASWLWIDLPWIEPSDFPRNIAYGVFT
jgi:hypothetical protein